MNGRYCTDCGQPTNRPPRAVFCYGCRDRRAALRDHDKVRSEAREGLGRASDRDLRRETVDQIFARELRRIRAQGLVTIDATRGLGSWGLR